MSLEDKPDDRPVVEVPPIEGYSELQIKYNLLLMHEAGLIRCEIMRSTSTPERVTSVIPFGLTWQGHEFLDASRNETVWQNVVERLKQTGISATLSVLQSLLVNYMRQKLDI